MMQMFEVMEFEVEPTLHKLEFEEKNNFANQKSAGGAGLSRPSWEAKDTGESLDDFAT